MPLSHDEALLQLRNEVTSQLEASPYHVVTYLERARVYAALQYPDLAVADAYRALTLTDELRNETYEFHEQAREALEDVNLAELPQPLSSLLGEHLESLHAGDSASDEDDGEKSVVVVPPVWEMVSQVSEIRSYQLLASQLLLLGCLRPAHDFCEAGLKIAPTDVLLQQEKQRILDAACLRLHREDPSPHIYPEWGLARREVYPWSQHEPDRFSAESLAYLNSRLQTMAPKCEVRKTELPVLHDSQTANKDSAKDPQSVAKCYQLGLFAKEEIAPGEAVLREYSLVTANNRLQDSVCDACGTELPPLGVESTAVSCEECDDTIFCNQFCYDKAMESYHPVVCEKDVDAIARDVEACEADQTLHFLLLTRILSIAAHQDVHPLDTPQIKYIWGDFVPVEKNRESVDKRLPEDVSQARPPSSWSLPFHFEYNVKMPLHFLEKLDIDTFASIAHHDQWVFNTLYAKFRGTASARKNPQDGRPDVAAVHPFWCLANHDCDPNVTWEWGGKMVLSARDTRVVSGLPGVIHKDQEILNHYCDVTLPVRERREWANGSLGGWCMCKRCREEEASQ